MSGCGAHCRCADGSSDKEKVCLLQKGGVSLDASGQCRCGKMEEDCCLPVRIRQLTEQAGHKDVLQKEKGDENLAVFELCKPHGLRHLCDG